MEKKAREQLGNVFMNFRASTIDKAEGELN